MDKLPESLQELSPEELQTTKGGGAMGGHKPLQVSGTTIAAPHAGPSIVVAARLCAGGESVCFALEETVMS